MRKYECVECGSLLNKDSNGNLVCNECGFESTIGLMDEHLKQQQEVEQSAIVDENLEILSNII